MNLSSQFNWDPQGAPVAGDICIWSNLVAGNLTLTNSGTGGNPGDMGVSWVLDASQAGNVSFVSPIASGIALMLGHTTNNSSSGAILSWGDATANVFNFNLRVNGTTPYIPHYLINNSSNPNLIYPNVRWTAGGGNPHTLIFGGTGNWIVTNGLITANGVGMNVWKQDSGTLYWYGPSLAGAAGNSSINSSLIFSGGTVVLKNGNPLTTQSFTNNAVLQYDAPSQSQTLSGVIRGAGTMVVSAGTLTLSGASTYSGSTILTNSGTLILGSAHTPGTSGPIGVGGTIYFGGGTLQFSVNNTFDYSSRFSADANQGYRFDTAGQSVTFTNTLGSVGGTLAKLGSGTLTLGGTNSYSGSTTVSAGKLVVQGPKPGTGDISVANGTTLGVYDTGTQVTPGTLTLGTSSGVTLEFNNVNNTGTAIIAANALSAGGTVTVNVNSGTFAIGQSYPLLTWTSGSAPTFNLGTLTGAGGNISVSGNTLFLNVTSLAFVWSGLNNGNWDTTTANNWVAGGAPAIFQNGNTALFDDTAAGTTNVTLNGIVQPSGTTINSSAKIYSIVSSPGNYINGTGGLTKSGNSTLTLSGGVNSFTGPASISSGTVAVGALANGGIASDIGASSSAATNLVLNGGTLQYTGPAQASDRLFTLGTGGGAINASGSGALALNNSGVIGLNGTGARTLTLTGSSADDNTLASVLGDNGGATVLAKTGAGKWIVTGNNTNSGTVTVSAGTLQVGTGGTSGSLGTGSVVDNGTLVFNRSDSYTSGTISGNGSVTVGGGGTLTIPGDNTYTGGTTVSNSTLLRIGIGGATGSINGGSAITDNGTIEFNSTSGLSIGGVISGTGNLVKRGSGLLKLTGNNTFSGWTYVEAGARLQVCEGNQGQYASPIITNNGTVIMTRQDNPGDATSFTYSGSIVGTGALLKDNNNQNFGQVLLTGTNTYTGGTFIGGGGIILGDGNANGWINGDVTFTNSSTSFDNPRRLTFNRNDDITFAGNITSVPGLTAANSGLLMHTGTGKLTLTGNNTYTGGTSIGSGTLQIGAGGTGGSAGSGTITNNGVLIFDKSNVLSITNSVVGFGNVLQIGSGTTVLATTNTYLGSTTVSNGALIINGPNLAASTYVYGGTLGGTGSCFGPITLDPGTTLAPGDSATSIGTLTLSSDLSIGGNMTVKVNKTLAQSNDVVVVGGSLNNTGTGTLTVANLGPALAPGDKFTVFSQPVVNGAAILVTGSGATWTNNLADDGSITVLTATSVATNPTNITAHVSGNTLQLTWPGDHLGWTLLTNSVGLTATNSWFPVPNSASTTNVNIPLDTTKTNVFFRLVYPYP